MNLYTPYAPHKDDKKKLLLQRHFSTVENNVSSKQLAFPTPTIINAEDENKNYLNNKLIKPKRNQVKNACVNCQKACKKCDEGRPCQRCIKYNLVDTCQNSIRKERKKGVKRGPYKVNNNKLKETNKKKLKTTLEQWPVVHDEVYSINGNQQQAKPMPVLPSEDKMKFVTQIASYHNSMSKYIANAQHINFDLPAVHNQDVQYNYNNSNNMTTIPSPMSHHNDTNVVTTNRDAYIPPVPLHEQGIVDMYALCIPNNNNIIHYENGANSYGTPTGSPNLLYSQNTANVPSSSWRIVDHSNRFLSNHADLF